MKKPNKIHYFSLLSTCWRYVEGKRKQFVLFYALSICAIVIWLIQIYVFSQSIGALQTAGDDVISELVFWAGIYFGLEFVFWAFHGPSRVIERHLAFYIVQNFTQDMYKKISHLPMSWHQNHHSGNIINRVKKANDSLYRFAGGQFFHIHNFSLYTGSIIALLLIDLKIGLIVTGVSLATLFGISKCNIFQAKLQKEANEREHFLHSALFDYISNIFTVITLRLEKTTYKEVSKRFSRIFPPIKKDIFITEYKWFGMSIVMVGLTAGSVLFYAWTAEGTIMIATAVLIYQYVERVNHTFEMFSITYSELIRQSVDVMSVDYILEDYEKIDHSKEDIAVPKWEKIEIKEICFSYEDKEHHMHQCENLALEFFSNKKVALVGESGAGKSTLMSLMRGLYFPDKASLVIDGEEYDGLYPLYAMSTLVPQEPEIFENTIRYNITVGLEYSEKEIEEAIRVSCFDSVIKELPKGLDTDIREKGVNLSGGQKQRLALARGVLSAKERSIILLDEPTSSVDASNERIIYQNLFEYYEDKCIISSIHRLHLLPEFDYIFVLDEGVIVEQGTFDELVNKEGYLKNAWAKYMESSSFDI